MPDEPPEARRHKYTPAGQQASALERLMQNMDKPVKLPEPPQEKSVRPPPDMVPNVGSSTAGAGSGEFHVYTQARQREYQRLNILAEKAEKETQHAQFVERQERLAAEDERKTSKNRARRDKKKAAAQRAKAASAAEDAPRKRRLVAPDDSAVPEGTSAEPRDAEASPGRAPSAGAARAPEAA